MRHGSRGPAEHELGRDERLLFAIFSKSCQTALEPGPSINFDMKANAVN
jgi:hypothetical protein